VGSFGVVKLSKNVIDNNYYAIKIIDIYSLNPIEIKCVEREIRAHIQLDNPHIIKLYGSFMENNIIYMVMDWAQNGNLFLHLKRSNLSEPDAIKFFY